MRRFHRIATALICGALIISATACEKNLDPGNPTSYETTIGTTSPTTAVVTRFTDATETPAPADEKVERTQQTLQLIENSFRNSANFFEFISVICLGDETTAMGSVLQGSFTAGQIIEYIDFYGRVRKASITQVTSIYQVDTADSRTGIVSFGIRGTGLDISRSTCFFKSENYKGLHINVETYRDSTKQLADYLAGHNKFPVKIGDETYDVELVSYVTDVNTGISGIDVIFDKDFPYDEAKKLVLVDLNLEASMGAQLS